MTDLLDASERAAPGDDSPSADAARSAFAAPTGSPLPAPVPLAPPAASDTPVPPAPPVAAPTLPAAHPAEQRPVVPELSLPDHQPRQDQARPLPGTLPVDLTALQAPTPRRARGTSRGLVKGFLKLAVLGGLVAAGVVYGPDLYEQYVEEPTDTRTLPSVADGPPAPLSFPAPVVTPAVASATFELSVDAPTGSVDYLVTADFASATTETVVRRPDAPELQIITVADQALIRRVDDDVWFRTQRGGFPFDATLARQQWVRFADELFSPEVRSAATIEGAAQHDVDGIPTRHLLVSVPSAALEPPPDLPALRPPLRDSDPATEIPEAPEVPEPTTVPPNAVVPNDAVPADGTPAVADAALTAESADTVPADSIPTDPAPVDPTVAAAPPAGEAAPPAAPEGPGGPPTSPDAVPPTGADAAPTTVPPPPTTTVEVWIDDSGIVRQGVGAEVFGVDRVRVTSISPTGWAPTLPLEEQIRPLDAEAVLHLGL